MCMYEEVEDDSAKALMLIDEREPAVEKLERDAIDGAREPAGRNGYEVRR